MDLAVLDFETFYSREFSLSKLTTEEYIRDDRFEVIGVCAKHNDGPVEWVTGDHWEIQRYLDSLHLQDKAVLAHNMMFDGAILSWRFGVRPKLLLDTLSMSRAWHGVDQRHSLAALAKQYELPDKGTEVQNAMGLRRADFSDEQLAAYGEYCKHDVDLCLSIFNSMISAGFPKRELQLIDKTLRMFTEPRLELDLELLEGHLIATQRRKQELLDAAGVTDKKDLMSNNKFADLLEKLGVDPPMKVSPTTGKLTYAFAKTDPAMKELEEHENPHVQTLVAARLGNKSTLEETRTERFMSIAGRGKLPIPLRYYAAHTGRWGGSDKINLQNLPSRGPNAKKLKKAIRAPEGHMLIDCDSSQIEARVLAWLAGQDDLVTAFANGDDVYIQMAAKIYGVPEKEVTKDMRFVGKTTILGCIAEKTPVMTQRGWVPIEQITEKDRLWDGVEWVGHGGLIPKGTKPTLNVCGSWLTPDHKILCGHQWREAASVVRDASTLSLALDTGAALWLSPDTSKAHAGGSATSSCSATADAPSTWWIPITSKTSNPPGALLAAVRQVTKNVTGNTTKLCRILNIVRGCSTALLHVSPAAILQRLNTTPITGLGVSPYAIAGVRTGQSSCGTSRLSPGGMTPTWRWTAAITPGGTNPATFGSSQEKRTWQTDEKSQFCSRNSMTYDIAYAGPRNRFTIATDAGPIIVHNCGYGMGAEKFAAQLKNFGHEIDEDEARRIIDIYRYTNSAISGLWKEAQQAVKGMVHGDRYAIGIPGVVSVDPTVPGIVLPSGLTIGYRGLLAEQGTKGYEYTYKTRNGPSRIYGGKVVENIVQGLARCVVGEQLLKIAKRYRVVLTVHDSIVSCVPEAEVDEAREYIEQRMRTPPKWAAGLPINCESEVGKSYGG